MDKADYKNMMAVLSDIRQKILEEDEHEKERFATLNKHFDEVAHKEMEEAAEMFKNMKKTDGISISALPKAIQLPLKAFDADGDNTISPEELMHGAELYKAAKDKTKVMARIAGFLGVLLVLMIGAITGTTFAMIEVTKESHTGGEGALTPANSEAPSVATGSASQENVLDSANGDFYFKNLNEISIGGFDGRVLSFKVSGFYRQPCVSCSSGSVVSVITDGGVLDVTDRHLDFAPSAVFQNLDVAGDDFDFHTWRRGPNAEEPFDSVTGRAVSGNNGRRLLTENSMTQDEAETYVNGQAGWDTAALSKEDLTDSLGSEDLWGVAPCDTNNEKKCMSAFNKNLEIAGTGTYANENADSIPYAESFSIRVPDFFSFNVWRGKPGTIGFHIVPQTGDGALAIPGFSWDGVLSGTMKMEYDGPTSDSIKTKGTMHLLNNNKKTDSFNVVSGEEFGTQAIFMHEIDVATMDSLKGELAGYDCEASIFVETMFNLPKYKTSGQSQLRVSNSMVGIFGYVKVTLAVAMAGFEMQTTALSANLDWGPAQMYDTIDGNFPAGKALKMKMFGTKIDTKLSRRRMLAEGETLETKLKGGIANMLKAMNEKAPLNTLELDKTADYMRERKYFDFAASVNERNGNLLASQGKGGLAAVAALSDDSNADAVGPALGSAGSTSGTDVVSVTTPITPALSTKSKKKNTKKKKKGKK